MMVQPKIKRILLKLSGETLQGKNESGIDPEACRKIGEGICALSSSGIEVGIVFGGGNFFRGVELTKLGLDATPSDLMGMLATLINSIALKETIEKLGMQCKILSALDCPKVAELFTLDAAKQAFSDGKIILFAGGTGNPYFTTDTAAALRACEIGAELLLKATKVDGVYNKDPLKYPDAVKFETLSYSHAIEEQLGIMDTTALVLCRNHNIPIFVFHMEQLEKNRIKHIFVDYKQGTLVKSLEKKEKTL